jgi:hypothetical protein
MQRVLTVSAGPTHSFSKSLRPRIDLIAGEGIAGDAHRGVTVKHRSRVAVDPTKPNLRQIHLIHHELFAELGAAGFSVRPGDLGENLLTEGVDLLNLPRGARLRLGDDAVIEITGLRNPCTQLNAFQPGLMDALVWRAGDGSIIRKAGVMGIVLQGGPVQPGDLIDVTLPPKPHERLERV